MVSPKYICFCNLSPSKQTPKEMSFFGKIFGKGGDKGGVSTGEAIQKLRDTEEMLLKKQDFLESKINQEVATAKKNSKTNKRAALQALKRKKRFEKQLQQIDGTLSGVATDHPPASSGRG